MQRRESTPCGAGTKLILNVGVSGVCCKVDRQSEKFVRLATVGKDTSVVMYLFKVKNVTEGDELEEKLKEVLKESGGEGEKKEDSAAETS